jgi:Fe-S cluster assembly iron-binding protein IscA
MEVTQAAKEALKEKLVANTEEADVCIRLKADPENKLGLVLGREAEGDTVVEHEDKKLLLVAQELAESLKNAVIDVEDTQSGRKLVVRPKAE